MGINIARLPSLRGEKFVKYFYRSKRTDKMPSKLITNFKNHKPLWVMGALLFVSHIGWKRLQTVEGIHPNGPSPADDPYPLRKFIQKMKARIDGGGGLFGGTEK